MDTKIIIRSLSIVLIMLSSFIFFSCTKTADGDLSKNQAGEENKNLEATAVEEKDFAESDEDLSTVDYKEFYEQLAPHGEWIQVKPEDIGLKPQTVKSDVKDNSGITLSGLMGIRDAFASSYENNGLVYVWKPSQSLAVTNDESTDPVYVPYNNGKWVNTKSGWYFKANTPAEETTSHYGRWVKNPKAGWLWVPGRVWAPAWVDWKQNDQYVSWAPLPPSVYMVNGVMNTPVIDNSNYMIVEKKNFAETDVYKYNNNYYQNGERIVVNDFASILGLVLVDNVLVNKGPDVELIQTLSGKNIELISIQPVKSYTEVRYNGNEYYVYKHSFKRYKSKDNKKFNVNQPKSYKKYGEWNENRSDNKEEKNYEKQLKNDEKELKKNEKELRKEIKKNDDNDMYEKNKDKKDDGKKNKNDKGGNENKGNEQKGSDGNKDKNNGNKKNK